MEQLKIQDLKFSKIIIGISFIITIVSLIKLQTAPGNFYTMIKLANELSKKNIPFLWLIFTNDTNAISNPNVIYMKPRLDVRPYINAIKGKGYGVQLSDSERRLLLYSRM